MERSLRLLTACMSSSMEKKMERNYFSAWAQLAGTPVWTRVLTGIESTFSKARVWRLEVQPYFSYFLNVNFSLSSLKLRVWVEVKTFSAFLASVTVTFCLVPMPNLSLSILLLSCMNFKVSVFFFFFRFKTQFLRFPFFSLPLNPVTHPSLLTSFWLECLSFL